MKSGSEQTSWTWESETSLNPQRPLPEVMGAVRDAGAGAWEERLRPVQLPASHTQSWVAAFVICHSC